MLNYKVWSPVKLENLPKGTKLIPSSAFLKEMFTAQGIFEKLKGRIVAGGHRQDRSIYSTSDTKSPTPDINSILLLACIGCMKGFKTTTGDVESAYLNAPMP